MLTPIQEETVSINSIYGSQTLIQTSTNPATHLLRLPSHPSIVLRLQVPQNYPDAPLSVLGTETVGDDAPKGSGKRIIDGAKEVLGRVYREGDACLYDLIEEVGEFLLNEQILGESSPQVNNLEIENPGVTKSITKKPEQLVCPGDQPLWSLSNIITEKKSVFIARAARVHSPAQAKDYLQHLLATDKKVAKATHNITAWRIRGADEITFQDCDDDGETAAGGRLLHLMQLKDVWDVMVVVTRWYGGVHLGPDRFRIINATARDALTAGEFTEDTDAGRKKGSKP